MNHNQTGDMIRETDTSHSGCTGTIYFDQSQLRLTIARGVHKYRCEKCNKTWTFKRKK